MVVSRGDDSPIKKPVPGQRWRAHEGKGGTVVEFSERRHDRCPNCGGIKDKRATQCFDCACNFRGFNFQEGPEHHNWKGDKASDQSKRRRAWLLFPLGMCERCGTQATDHHHVDGDEGNNEATNVRRLCRKCHMIEDGRLANLVKRYGGFGPKPCSNCGRFYTPLRKGRCERCYDYLRRNGTERPRVQERLCN